MITYGSVCSGIEAASLAWEPLGWRAEWFAEIEKFPSAVLAHRWPHVPNLGDMTVLPEWIRTRLVSAPDVLVGGTPCQSWSVAGKRGGSEDPRGQLTFKFLEIVDAINSQRPDNPCVVVWENVPGIISAEGGAALEMFLDAFLERGYILNCDVLDAQFFGVAQRRRRVFLVCQPASSLMKQKTAISAITGATLFAEILHDILADQGMGLEKGHGRSDYRPENASDGLRRKIMPFKVHGVNLLQFWLRNLADLYLNAATGQEPWELNHGLGIETTIASSQNAAIGSLDSFARTANPAPFLSTSLSLKNCLGDLLWTASEYTTLTELKMITPTPIFTFVEALVVIGRYIARLNDCSPNYSKAVSSVLTTLQKGISYARHTNREVLSDAGLSGYGAYILQQAEHTSAALLGIRNELDRQEVFSVAKGVRRDTAPSREAGETVTGVAGESVKVRSHWDGDYPHPTLNQCYNTGGVGQSNQELFSQRGAYLCMAHISGVGFRMTAFREYVEDETASTCKMRDYKDATDLVAFNWNAQPDQMNFSSSSTPALTCSQGAAVCQYGDVAPRHDSSPCADRGMNVVAVPLQEIGKRTGVSTVDPRAGIGIGRDGDPMYTLQSSAQHGVAVAQNTRDEVRLMGGDGQIVGALAAEPGMKQTCYIATAPQLTVRRLTPRECERLQGMPDDHTAIPGAADGPRYKAIGNSKAVPVVQWLGRRLERVI